ncbi:MAG: hypothetical protein KA430_03230, partial [Bacteroidia bacterium]|nr:hypothetical protein [Bacteroidia bacterium]
PIPEGSHIGRKINNAQAPIPEGSHIGRKLNNAQAPIPEGSHMNHHPSFPKLKNKYPAKKKPSQK